MARAGDAPALWKYQNAKLATAAAKTIGTK
jgi:hypothetical protein